MWRSALAGLAQHGVLRPDEPGGCLCARRGRFPPSAHALSMRCPWLTSGRHCVRVPSLAGAPANVDVRGAWREWQMGGCGSSGRRACWSGPFGRRAVSAARARCTLRQQGGRYGPSASVASKCVSQSSWPSRGAHGACRTSSPEGCSQRKAELATPLPCARMLCRVGLGRIWEETPPGICSTHARRDGRRMRSAW